MKRAGSLAWYAGRLRAMTLAEVADRIGEQAKRLSYRRYARGFDDFRLTDGALPIIPGVREDLAAPASEALSSAIATAARRADAGSFTFLGQTWPAGIRHPDGRLRREAFFLDPVSGRHWEGAEAYCFDVDYRARPGWGDVKFVWEVNRLQFLQAVAVDALRNGSGARAAPFVIATIRDWMAVNPPFRGINWCSGIELGLRVATIVVVVSALGQGAFSAEEHAELRTFLNAHGFWIARYPSRHSSANNHLVMEALGLFLLGLLATDLPSAQAWESYGRGVLEREVTRQILDDGVGAEQSPTYTAFTLEAYLLAMLAATRAGRPLSRAVSDRVALAGRHLRSIMDDGGHVPEIGDNDAGRVIAMAEEPELLYVASLAGAVAAMTGEPLASPRFGPRTFVS